jgi:hypothetical protein
MGANEVASSFDVTFKRPVETLRAAFKRMRKDCSFDQERLLRTVSDKKLLIILNYHGTLCGGSAAMQIRSLMQPGAFGPEAIAAMGDALEAALKELQDIGQSDVQSEAVRETIAVRIIGAARLGERDPARLRAAALSGIAGRRDEISRRW